MRQSWQRTLFEQDEFGEKLVSVVAGTSAMQKALARVRPKAETTKLSLTVRYDADVIAAFKATGKGWQTKMNY